MVLGPLFANSVRNFLHLLFTLLRKQEQKQREVVKIMEDEFSFWGPGVP